MSFSCSACITAHFIQPLDILPRPVTKPDLQMLKKTLNPCGIFGVKKGQSGDECAICIREPVQGFFQHLQVRFGDGPWQDVKGLDEVGSDTGRTGE